MPVYVKHLLRVFGNKILLMRGIKKIYLNKIVENFAVLSAAVGENVKKICVVKADAYGHGIKEVVQALGDADCFAVATVDEAAEVRLVTDKRVLVLGYTDRCEKAFCAACGIEVAVWTGKDVEDAAYAAGGKDISVHIAIDSGMNRIGVKTEEELSGLIRAATERPNVKIKGVFSHLYAAEDRAAAFCQKEKFDRFCSLLPFRAERHLAATGGLTYPFGYEAVRFGIGLYGYGFSGVSPAMSVSGTVVRVSRLFAGETVGYGGEFIAERDCFAATLSLGYADGVSRRAAGGEVVIGGKRRKLVGRVCMDMCFALVDKDVSAGDEAVFLGSQGEETITAEDIARHTGTISYEVLTGYKRIKAVFIK